MSDNCQEVMKVFCGTNNRVARMDELFTRGDYTYATDGKIAIRVPRIDGVGDVDDAPHAERLDWDHGVIENWLALPEYELGKMSKCTRCHGSGFAVDCPHCERPIPLLGGGNVCEECFGCAVSIMEKVSIADTCFAVRYIELLKKLPSCVIASPLKPDGANLFKADGFEGLLMPLDQG